MSEEDFFAENEINNFTNSLPDDVRDKVGDISVSKANETADRYDLNFFLKEISSGINKHLPSAVSFFATVTSMVIVTGIFEKLSESLNTKDLGKAFYFCSSLSLVIAIYTMQKSSYTLAVGLLKTLTATMSLMAPLMEAVYISAGNTSLAAVSGTALTLTLTVVETIYTKVLVPAVSVSFILCTVSAASSNKGLAYLSKTIRGLITTAIVSVMALTSIVLSLQSGVAASADRFSQRAIRFALGNYIPLIGGSISESLSALTGSLSLIKQLSGTAGIVVLILMLLPPLISLILTRLSVYLSSAVSGLIGCDKAKELLDDIGGIYTMLICISIAASLTFIYALSVFCKSPLALG